MIFFRECITLVWFSVWNLGLAAGYTDTVLSPVDAAAIPLALDVV